MTWARKGKKRNPTSSLPVDGEGCRQESAREGSDAGRWPRRNAGKKDHRHSEGALFAPEESRIPNVPNPGFLVSSKAGRLEMINQADLAPDDTLPLASSDDRHRSPPVGTTAKRLRNLVRWIGGALIGGDFSGNRRGELAIDIQSMRAGPAQVASGKYAVALGNAAMAAGENSVAVGGMVAAGDKFAVAVGANCSAQAEGSCALGESTLATAFESNALGARAVARVAKTTNIGGPLIVRADTSRASPGVWFQCFSGPEIYLMSGNLDLRHAEDYSFELPAGCRFLIREVGLIVTAYAGVTAQPSIRFGAGGDLAKELAIAQTTLLLGVGWNERYFPATPEQAETVLSFGVTTPAVGTTLDARAWWRGVLIENE